MQRVLLTCLLVLSLAAGAAMAAEMTGIVTDAKCKHTDTSAASMKCAQECIKNGVPAVFVDTAHDNKVYKIANPDKIMDHVGHKVTVEGTVDGDTLTVASVKMKKKS
jgi:hypothetical protein